MAILKFLNIKLEKKAYADIVNPEDALSILEADSSSLFDFIASANRIRQRYKGNAIRLCSIINAKSGRCGEDCAFCSQSAYHRSTIEEYPFIKKDTILNTADLASHQGAHKFGIVTSGKGIKDREELHKICEAVKGVSAKMHACASLGILNKETLIALKEAGLKEYHHNLETARSFFPNICTTHSYDDNVNTVKAVKEAGLRVCCGGIFGMGETLEQRVELAFTLKKLDVDSVPLNFLTPIKGTAFENAPLIKPVEALKIIVMFRFVHPQKDIKIAGGREKIFRDLQSLIFAAGANSTMIGNYLTTKGRNYKEDIQMIKDLEMEIE